MEAFRRDQCGGLILCGGRSSRMGSEKAGLRFPGGTLLSRALERMAQVADPVVLSLALGQETPSLPPGVLAVRDEIADQGPLWGLDEGFRRLEGLCRRVVVMPVDMPFFTPRWMAGLVDGLEGHRACLYEHQGFKNGLTAAYGMELRPKLERLVADGKRRPIYLCEGEPTRILPVAEDEGAPGGHPLSDVDTPDAYREALLLEGVGRRGAAEVTVELASGPGDAGEGLCGFVALFADSAGEVLDCLRRLYPEWDEPTHDGVGRDVMHPAQGPGKKGTSGGWSNARLLRLEGSARGEALEGSAPLWRGEHLRLEIGAGLA